MQAWLTTGKEWVRHRLLSTLLSAGATIVMLEWLTGGWFDFILDIILLGFIVAANKLARRR